MFVHKKFYKETELPPQVEAHIGEGNPSLWRSVYLGKEVEKSSIDVFHGLSAELPFYLPHNIKKVVTVHDVMFDIFPHQYASIDRVMYRNKLRYALNNADKIIAVSQSTKQDLQKFYSIEESRIDVVYPTWSPSFDTEIAETTTLADLPENYFLFVGNEIERKNLKTVLKALNKEKLPLVVITPNRKKVIKEYSKQLKKLEKGQVTILENISDSEMPAFYSNAYALIYPSLYEGFGLPVLEALKSGIPAITTNNSSLKEVGAKGCLLMKKPTNVEELIDNLKTISDSEYYKKLKLQIKPHLSSFEPKSMVSELMKIYE